MTPHPFVIPMAIYAVKLLLMMGKERPKHVEFPELKKHETVT
jgi:hypothetical protein